MHDKGSKYGMIGGSLNDKLEAAIKSLMERLEIEPGSGDFHYGLAALFALKGDFGSACDHLEVAKKLGVDVRVLEGWISAKETQATEETT